VAAVLALVQTKQIRINIYKIRINMHIHVRGIGGSHPEEGVEN
jgi:hypothetical protein